MFLVIFARHLGLGFIVVGSGRGRGLKFGHDIDHGLRLGPNLGRGLGADLRCRLSLGRGLPSRSLCPSRCLSRSRCGFGRDIDLDFRLVLGVDFDLGQHCHVYVRVRCHQWCL